jgi:hypothetical protein
MLFKEIIAVYSEDHKKHKAETGGKILRDLMLKQVVHINITGL